MRKAFFISAVSLALSAYPYASSAQNLVADPNTKKDITPVFKLGEISVPVDGSSVPGSRQVISSEEMTTYSDDETLESAIALLPGVDVSQVGRKNETSVSIRGFDMRQIVLMVDGVPTVMPYDAYPDLARVLTSDLSEIQVSKGLTSVLSGPNALGGVINMVSKRPTKKMEGDFSIKAMPDKGIRTALNIGSNQGKYYVQAGAAYSDLSKYRLPSAYQPTVSRNGSINQLKGNRDNSASEDTKLNFKVGFTPNDTDEYAIGYVFQDGEFEIPPYAGFSYFRPLGDSQQATQLTMPFWREYSDWTRHSVYALSNTSFGKTGYVKTRLSYDKFENQMDSYTDAQKTAPDNRGFPSLYDDFGVSGSVEAGVDTASWSTTKLAVHYRRDHHEESSQIGLTGEMTPWSETVDDTYSVGLENTFHVGKKMDVIVGASYDYLKVLEAEGEDQRGNAFTKHNDHSFNPMMAVKYRFNDTASVYAGMAQKSRFATQKARYSYRSGTAVPNANLKAEKAINYEIGGHAQITKALSFDAAVFYSAVRDTNLSVLLTSGPDVGLYQTQNFGRSRTYGAELGLVFRPSDNLKTGLAYTHLIRKLDDAQGLKPIDSPEHKVTMYADWRFAQRFRLIPTIEAYSSRYSTFGGNNVIGGAVRIDGPVGTSKDGERVSGFMTAGLKLTYEPKSDLEISAGVANIFDKYYELAEGYPQEGRNYFISMIAKF